MNVCTRVDEREMLLAYLFVQILTIPKLHESHKGTNKRETISSFFCAYFTIHIT